MKILIITPIFPPEIGGPATYVTKLTKLLYKKHTLSIIAFCSQKPITDLPANVTHISTKESFLNRQLKLFLQTFKQAGQSDLLYIQGTITIGFFSLLANLFHSKPTILKFVGDEVWEKARKDGISNERLEDFYKNIPLKLWPWVLAHRFVLHTIGSIMVPSKYLKDFLVETHGLNPQKITVIYNAIEVKPDPKIKKKPNQLVYVGRLSSWKHVDKVIEAVNLARKEKKWKLLIVGDGAERKKLEKLVKKLNANSWVSFTGNVDVVQARKHIQESEKLILYSDYEGLSHTLVEAMKLKTFIVASNIKPNLEALNGHGATVELHNPQALSKAINQPATKVASAQKYAEQTFSWETNTKDLQKLFKKQISR